MRVYPYSAKAIRLFSKHGYLVVLITNQSGIGRGFFEETTLSTIHEKLIEYLKSEDSKLDAIYYCPHIPKDVCACRKPKPGLIMRAESDFQIDLANSWMIGDKSADIEAGIAAGTKTALVLTGYGKVESSKIPQKPDLTGGNLFEVAKLIISEIR